MPRKMKTVGQNKRIFGLKSQLGLEHEDLREIAFLVSEGRVEEISKLTYQEADLLIKNLQSKLPKSDETPRRTVNYRKQIAGVKTLVTATHLDLMRKLWREDPTRTDAGLENFCLRNIKRTKPRYSSECTKIIEALKQMNARARKQSEMKEAA